MESKPVNEQNPSEGTIIGDVIIGEVDPSSLSEEEFNQNTDLLYHGTSREFVYSPVGDFDPNDSADASNDYGTGFYLTPDRYQAEVYSHVRGAKEDDLKVYKFLPFQARMLDVRERGNLEDEGALPQQFVADWLDYLKSYAKDGKNFERYNEFLKEAFLEGIQEIFIERLEKAIGEGVKITIRQGHKESGIFYWDKNGLIDTIFRDFMLSKGYDGMVYVEAGEGKKAEQQYNFTSMVFYNPRVVDTLEGWRKRKAESNL